MARIRRRCGEGPVSGDPLSTGRSGSTGESTARGTDGVAGRGSRQALCMHLSLAASAQASRQEGILSRSQLLEAGVTPDALRWRIGRDWRMVLPGVYALQTGMPSQQQRLVAAQLLAGSDSWLASTTAAALYGLRSCRLSPPIRLLVPRPRRSRRVAWVDIRATSLAGEVVVERGPLRLGCLPRAVVDAASDAPDEQGARGIVLEAVQRRMVRLDDLEHWVDARGRPGSQRLRRLLDEAASGAWSVRSRTCLRSSGPPPPCPSPWPIRFSPALRGCS